MTIFAKSIDMNIEEKWKPVVGYEGLYEVSSLGRVRSLSRSIQGHKGYYVIPSRILKGFYAYGYRYVELRKGGKLKSYRVHRLVAEAFLPNPNKYPIINHKNEIRDDNRVDNIEWCTHKYNSNYGNIKSKQKQSSHCRPIIQLTKEGIFVAKYQSIADASKATKIEHTNIIQCAKGKLLKCRDGKLRIRRYAGGFIWKYEE